MGSVPTPRTFVAGEIETAAYMNSLGAVLTFLQNPPRCRCYLTAAQAIVTATVTLVSFDTESWDTDGMHSTTTNPTRIVAQTPGVYQFVGRMGLADNAVGDRFVVVRKNGTTDLGRAEGPHVATSGNQWYASVVDEVYLAVGDYLEMECYQAGGANQNLVTGVTGTMLEVRWVAAS